MTWAERSVIVRAPLDRVWALVSDFERQPEWAPVRQAKLVTEQRQGLGMKGVMEFRDERLGSVQTEVIEWIDKQQIVRQVTGGPAERMKEIFRFEPVSEGTRFTFAVDFELSTYRKLFAGLVKRSIEKSLTEAFDRLKPLLEHSA